MAIDQPISFRHVRFKLEAAGFKGISQKGNHAKFIKMEANGVRTAILPHYQELAVSTVLSILRQAGITVEEFEKL